MRFFFSILIFLFIHLRIVSVFSLYSATSAVKVLDAAQLTKLKNSDDVWLVEFFSSGCGHCISFAPEYEKAAKALKGIVKVAAVEDQQASSSEGIRGFPTVKLYLGQSITAKEFKDHRTAEKLVDFVTVGLNSLAKTRMGMKGKTDKSKTSTQPGDVVEITDENFSSVVMADEKSVWFIEFYAPWCGHCKALVSTWEEVGRALQDKVKVGKVDATTNTQIAAKFSVQGYPTILLMPSGVKAISNVVRYNGERDLESFTSFAASFAAEAVKAMQLLNHSQFIEQCSKGVCLIAFLPHLLDSGAKGRESYLKRLDEAVKFSLSMPVKYLWVEGGKNFQLEEKLRLQFGFPAVIATRVEKQKYAIHKGDFSSQSIRSFLTGLISGRYPLDPLPEHLPEFVSTVEWDGKEFPVKPAAAVEKGEESADEEL